jgi:hypothetical protein
MESSISSQGLTSDSSKQIVVTKRRRRDFSDGYQLSQTTAIESLKSKFDFRLIETGRGNQTWPASPAQI